MQLGYCNSLVGQNRPRGVSFVGALDAFTTDLAGAWSVARRLLSSYAGPLIRARRDTDSDELDIGYLADGSLDTAALLTFAGAGSAYVTTIYDQSGGSNDAAQSTGTYQPKIVNTGSLILCGGIPSAQFVNTPVAQALEIAGLNNTAVKAFSGIIVSNETTWSNYGCLLGSEAGAGGGAAYRLAIYLPGTTQCHSDPFPVALRQNGVALSSPFSMTDIDAAHVQGIDCNIASSAAAVSIPRNDGVYGLNVCVSEVVAWGSVADRSAFEANQMALIGL